MWSACFIFLLQSVYSNTPLKLFPRKPHRTKIKHSHGSCQRLNKLPFSVSDICFVWGYATPAQEDNFISKLWAQMRDRQLVHVSYMSTFHGTNGMSIKRQNTDAFSPVGKRCFLVMQLCCSSLTLGALGIFCPFTSPYPLTPFQTPWLLTISSVSQVCLLRFNFPSKFTFFAGCLHAKVLRWLSFVLIFLILLSTASIKWSCTTKKVLLGTRFDK